MIWLIIYYCWRCRGNGGRGLLQKCERNSVTLWFCRTARTYNDFGGTGFSVRNINGYWYIVLEVSAISNWFLFPAESILRHYVLLVASSTTTFTVGFKSIEVIIMVVVTRILKHYPDCSSELVTHRMEITTTCGTQTWVSQPEGERESRRCFVSDDSCRLVISCTQQKGAS